MSKPRKRIVVAGTAAAMNRIDLERAAPLIERERRRGAEPLRPVRPDIPPTCPGCSRAPEWSSDPDRPHERIATCSNPWCGEVSIWGQVEGRPQVLRRIPSADRRRD